MNARDDKKVIRRGKRIMSILLSVILTILLVPAIIFFILSPGKIKQFTDDSGNVIKNSIAEKNFVEINGVRMGMIIKSKDISNPVLLFVHGGPGMPEYFLTEHYPTGLEDYFTVVWWDQRGAGLSYSSDIDKNTMTTNQFVDDIIGVTQYLRERFDQDKIYLMSHSFGTTIGIEAAKKAPELYNAYIGVAQVTYQSESEKLAYEYMVDYYEKIGDKKALKKLKNTDYLSSEYGKIRDSLMHKAGIGTTHNMTSVVREIFFESLVNKEYTVTEKINLWRGKIFSGSTSLRAEEHSVDFRKTLVSLDIPVYFFSGVHDYTVNYKMTEDYFKNLKAPIKGFYLFENSAHSPIFEEPEKVADIIQYNVLKGTNTLVTTK